MSQENVAVGDPPPWLPHRGLGNPSRMRWAPISREDARIVVDQFFARREGVNMPFEEYVRLREAFLVLTGTDEGTIRRELEEVWGIPLE